MKTPIYCTDKKVKMRKRIAPREQYLESKIRDLKRQLNKAEMTKAQVAEIGIARDLRLLNLA